MERILETDVLNFGVGGYGFDQIYLYFRRTELQHSPRDSIYLIGLIPDDMARMLFKIRARPKPYFTVENGELIVHTAHINRATFNEAFKRPAERSYLYFIIKAKVGRGVLDHFLATEGPSRWQQVDLLTLSVLDEFKNIETERSLKLAFVLYPYLPATENHRQKIRKQIESKGLRVIDLGPCFDLVLNNGERTLGDLFDDSDHPTPLGNNLIAQCLAKEVVKLWQPT